MMDFSDELADPAATISGIGSREQMAQFLAALRRDLLSHKEEWQNRTLEDYLESMEAWLTRMGNDTFEEQPHPACWRAMAWMLWGEETMNDGVLPLGRILHHVSIRWRRAAAREGVSGQPGEVAHNVRGPKQFKGNISMWPRRQL